MANHSSLTAFIFITLTATWVGAMWFYIALNVATLF